MRKLFFLILIPFFSFSQSFNQIDISGKRQGDWKKYHNNGKLRYKGQFIDDIPSGIFKYYYDTGELKLEKVFS